MSHWKTELLSEIKGGRSVFSCMRLLHTTTIKNIEFHFESSYLSEIMDPEFRILLLTMSFSSIFIA